MRQGVCQQSLEEPIVAVDIETTGLDRKRCRLTESGAVVLDKGEVTERFQIFVNPGMRIPEEIVRLTGITDEMVADAPSQEEALRAFLDCVKDRPLAAHNAEFDMGFIREGCERHQIPFSLSC